MNLGLRFDGFLVKFFDDFVCDGIARLVAINFDEKTERLVMFEDGESFFAELLKAVLKNFKILVVAAVAAVV